MGSFAAQQFILDHSHSIDGLALSGSGTLDGLAHIAQGVPAAEDCMSLMNAHFEPARTPFDWLSRDKAEVDAIITGSEDPVRRRLEGVRALIERYRSTGITSIAHDFYPSGRHEMLHELNRWEVVTNLLAWISGILERASR